VSLKAADFGVVPSVDLHFGLDEGFSMDGNQRRRRFEVAMVLALVCGAVALLCAALATFPLMLALLSGHTRFAAGHVFYFAAVTITMALPGAIYLFIAWQLHKRRPWSAIVGVAVAAFHDACALVGLVALLWYVPAHGGPVLWAPILGAVVFMALCSALLYQLGRVLRGGSDEVDAGAGFEVLGTPHLSDNVREK
jgi:hypothetical protein